MTSLECALQVGAHIPAIRSALTYVLCATINNWMLMLMLMQTPERTICALRKIPGGLANSNL